MKLSSWRIIKVGGRNLAVGVTYLAIIVVSLWLSVLLRFDFDVPYFYSEQLWTTLIWFAPSKLFFLLLFSQFRSLLTFFSISDATRLLLAMFCSLLLGVTVWYASAGQAVVPRSSLLTDFLVSTMAFGVLRTTMRVYREQVIESKHTSVGHPKRVAIVGAGSAGSTLLREIQSKRGLGMQVVCFFDDDESKIGGALHGRRIAGRQKDLPRLIREWCITRVIIAMPSAAPLVIRQTVEVLNQLGIEHDILPSVTQLLRKSVSVSHLRHVEPEDLLGRQAVKLDDAGIRDLISNRKILVTGAGGSIGAELCRQIALYKPALLVLLDRSEPALFQIEQELIGTCPGLKLEALSTSVTDCNSMEKAFARLRPEVVFHAAAHKHVPLMESQPYEAIFNNSSGTQAVGRLAGKYGVGTFVLVSTDKAVNPTNVMGASKRLAELILLELQENESRTQFSSVRFGNVLGSSGSVIPVFRKQIAEGGPVRVTHPDITRYFMSIPEAVGLVLQCALQARGGEVFVLDMGEPVKIIDLARQMIELSGFKADEDIQIAFTGLRPGEKLYEEPIHIGADIARTAHPKILTLRRDKTQSANNVNAQLTSYLADGLLHDPTASKRWLGTIVGEYRIWKG